MSINNYHGRIHYAWIILASVMMLYIVSTGVRFSFGVMVDPLVESYGWSRGGISMAYTLSFLTGIPAVLVVGRLAESIGSRRIIIFGAVVFIIGLLLTSTITELWQFQLYFGVFIGGLGSAPFIILLPVLLSRWFNKKLGLALGLMWASMSLGPAVLSPLLRGAIDTIGWEQTFLISGVAGGALLLFACLFIRDNPQRLGIDPYGGKPAVPVIQNSAPTPDGIRLRQVTGMASFWMLVAVHTLGCVGHSLPLAHMVSIATFAGVPGLAATGILSITLTTSLISRFGMSLVAESRGSRFTLSIAVLLQTLPTLILLVARQLPAFYLFGFLFGLGYGGEMVGFPIFNRQFYGADAPLNSIYSFQMAGAMAGMALGGWLGGAIFDWTGAYTWSIWTAVTAGFIGLAVAFLLPSHRR